MLGEGVIKDSGEGRFVMFWENWRRLQEGDGV